MAMDGDLDVIALVRLDVNSSVVGVVLCMVACVLKEMIWRIDGPVVEPISSPISLQGYQNDHRPFKTNNIYPNLLSVKSTQC